MITQALSGRTVCSHVHVLPKQSQLSLWKTVTGEVVPKLDCKMESPDIFKQSDAWFPCPDRRSHLIGIGCNLAIGFLISQVILKCTEVWRPPYWRKI